MRRCSKWWRTRRSESCAARKASPSIPLAFFFLLIGFAVLERASFALSLSRCRGIDALLVRLEAPTRNSPERRSRCVATLRESPSSAWNPRSVSRRSAPSCHTAGKPLCRPARQRACVPAIERCTPRARSGQRRSLSTSPRACMIYPNGYVVVKLAALAVRPPATWVLAGDPDLSVIHVRGIAGESDMSRPRVTTVRSGVSPAARRARDLGRERSGAPPGARPVGPSRILACDSLPRQSRQEQGAGGGGRAGRELVHQREEVAVVLRASVDEQDCCSTARAHDADESLPHREIEDALPGRIRCRARVARQASAPDVAARDRHAARVGDAGLTVVMPRPARRHFLGLYELDLLAAGCDGDGRLIEVGGEMRDGGHDEIVRAGDADDGAGGNAAHRRGGADQVPVGGKSERLERAALLGNVNKAAGQRDLRRGAVRHE